MMTGKDNPLGRSMAICPRDCQDRKAGCHGSCERYAERKAEYRAHQDAIHSYKVQHGQLLTARGMRDRERRGKK